LARTAGKLDPTWTIPDRYRKNTPQTIDAMLAPAKAQGLFPLFPFGSDFDAIEVSIVKALRWLKANTARPGDRVRTMVAALGVSPGPAEAAPLLRLGYDKPLTLN